MKILRRKSIPQRLRIFLGCEGQSEQSYGKLISNLYEADGQGIYIDTVVLQPGSGDPLALVEQACRKLSDRTRSHGSYAAKAILLDSDNRHKKPERDEQAYRLAAKNGLRLIWQEPCHEGFLLLHLNNSHTLRPTTPVMADTKLKKIWLDYQKPMSTARLATKIDRGALKCAALAAVPLKEFLAEIDRALRR